MTEAEIRAYALSKGWTFVRVNALAMNGYWKDAEGKCYYAKQVIELVKQRKGEKK